MFLSTPKSELQLEKSNFSFSEISDICGFAVISMKMPPKSIGKASLMLKFNKYSAILYKFGIFNPHMSDSSVKQPQRYYTLIKLDSCIAAINSFF